MPAEAAGTRYVGFVRNIMIGREGLHRQVLLDIFSAAGTTAPRSYLSTGNVSFSSLATLPEDVVGTVEDGIAEVIDRHEPVFVRSVAELAMMVSSDPFSRSPFVDPVDRTVSFTRQTVELGEADLPILSRRGDVAIFETTGREVYSVARLVDGKTSGGGGLVEKTIGQRVTTRSWNTVLRIVNDPAP